MQKSALTVRALTYVVADTVVLNVLYFLSFWLRFQTTPLDPHSTLLPDVSPALYFQLEAFLTVAWIASAFAFGLYGDTRGRSFREEVFRLSRALLAVAVVTVVALVFTRVGIAIYSRWFLITFAMVTTGGMILYRGVLHFGRGFGAEQRNVLVIGAGRTGVRLFENLSSHPSGYKVIGFLDNNGLGSSVRPMILGRLGDLDRVAERHLIDEVVIAMPAMNDDDLRLLIDDCENLCLRVNIVPNEHYYESATFFEGKMTAVQVGDIPLIRVRQEPLDKPTNKLLKRTFDFLFSLFVLAFVFPFVFLFAAIGIKLTSRGAVFFKQERTGEGNSIFFCYKFRTMRSHPRHVADSVQAMRDDDRVTAIGRLLRRTNLDELPQFWNVLKGEMSVVGPRPHMVKHTTDYRRLVERYMVRHLVKPGVTGWAQVNGLRGATETPLLMQKRVEHDIYYIEHWSFWLDIKIILLTVRNMVLGDEHAY
jgi:putative colanic acid biosynthesis UDP-glucose lipid carrier transferase